tara:strand:- start:15565 stop:16398 length:834 start_codon:yes stop_codon:yes gene_type:complete
MVYKNSQQSFSKLSTSSGGKLLPVRVLDIILDLNHPMAETYGGYDAIGTISFTYIEDNTPLEKPWFNKQTAKPIFSFIKNYPLINEVCLIISTYDKNNYKKTSKTNFYLPNLNVWNHPHHNAMPTMLGMTQKQTAEDYQETENGLTRQVTDGSTNILLGNYFREQMNIKPLLPYEGDTILEGRYGNSIRLGSTAKDKKIPEESSNRWSNEGFNGDPILIIRNGQRVENINDKGWEPTVEDIDLDASSIYLTSNQQITNFIPASDNDASYYAQPGENL